jgi:AraC-like DNA-binding protein
VGEICAYIQQHHAQPLTLDDVADELDLCVSTLNSLLKRYRRETFLQYLTRVRLDHAKNSLQRGEGTITEVAFGCGFGSLATFNRRFRADQGMTPGEYRQLHLEP